MFSSFRADAWRDATLATLVANASTWFAQCAEARDASVHPDCASLAQHVLFHVQSTVANSVHGGFDQGPCTRTSSWFIESLHVFSPRATEAALGLLEDTVQSTPRADMYNLCGRPLAYPRVLSRAVQCVVAVDDGRCLALVRAESGTKTAKRDSYHVVVLVGLAMRRNAHRAPLSDNFNGTPLPEPAETDAGESGLVDDLHVAIDDSEGDRTLSPDASGLRFCFGCDCPAFVYQQTGERHCKHILAACVAIATGLASIDVVPKRKFTEILERDER